MNKNLKRFLYYWRLPIFFFILFFVLMFTGAYLEGNAGLFFGVVWLMVDIPCLIFFTIRSIYIRIRDAVAFRRTGVRNEEFNFPEVNFIRAVAAEIESVRKLPPRLKARYFALRILGIAIIIGGCIGCFYFAASYVLLALFALVIIAGATICLIANPKRYNEQVEGVRMVTCQCKLTEENLIDTLRTISTPLGSPHLAIVKGFKKPIIVYGSAEDSSIYVVYHAKFSDIFYISTIMSSYLQKILPSANEQEEEEIGNAGNQDSDYLLNAITSAVEEAVERICEETVEHIDE